MRVTVKAMLESEISCSTYTLPPPESDPRDRSRSAEQLSPNQSTGGERKARNSKDDVMAASWGKQTFPVFSGIPARRFRYPVQTHYSPEDDVIGGVRSTSHSASPSFVPCGAAEKVSSLGKDWHKLCLKCDRCNKLLNAGGHAEEQAVKGPTPHWSVAPSSSTVSRFLETAAVEVENGVNGLARIAPRPSNPKQMHDGRPYCHKPCYAALFGPKGVNIGGAGSYVYDTPANNNPPPTCVDSASKTEEKRTFVPKAPSKAGSITTFSGEANMCPGCNKKVYFAEKVTSLGKDWHRPCLRCDRCSKTLAPGSHAEHDGKPYCHKPCYAVLFGPKGVNTGGVGSYIYEKEPSAVTQP
ncbi:Cysteine-rich protein 2 [Takifugu flavidus]|uniref:Cysteine-rich protein 2 n=1 Tax=Takifugu flavidus TaxID=433684 RepID=A0A5C6NX02_9TELE|nr:Cysteine-rich protein 2 [Takifugu flavidus]